MAVKKKRTAKKRTTKKRTTKKRTAKKRTARKRTTKKRTARKRTTKKRTTKRRSSAKRTTAKRSSGRGNRTQLKVELDKGSPVDGGPNHVWHVRLKSSQGSVTAGSVIGRNETAARRKAKALLRSLAG